MWPVNICAGCGRRGLPAIIETEVAIQVFVRTEATLSVVHSVFQPSRVDSALDGVLLGRYTALAADRLTTLSWIRWPHA